MWTNEDDGLGGRRTAGLTAHAVTMRANRSKLISGIIDTVKTIS